MWTSDHSDVPNSASFCAVGRNDWADRNANLIYSKILMSIKLFAVTPREAPCNQFGGACMDTCAPALRQSYGNDCGDKVCCILVNKK